MADISSDSLYNKLTEVNDIKRDIKTALAEIGGYELFVDDPKFKEYPNIIKSIHARIATIDRALDISIYGKQPTEVLSKAQTTYDKITPYLDELQYCRSLLIDNLNTKGVEANTTDTLRELVGKVKDITGGGEPEPGTPFSETILEYTLTDKVKLEFIHTGNYDWESKWYEEISLKTVNYSDETISLDDPSYYIKVDFLTEDGRTVYYWNYPITGYFGDGLDPGEYQFTTVLSTRWFSESEYDYAITLIEGMSNSLKNNYYNLEVSILNLSDRLTFVEEPEENVTFTALIWYLQDQDELIGVEYTEFNGTYEGDQKDYNFVMENNDRKYTIGWCNLYPGSSGVHWSWVDLSPYNELARADYMNYKNNYYYLEDSGD